jgi:hypothetical protein
MQKAPSTFELAELTIQIVESPRTEDLVKHPAQNQFEDENRMNTLNYNWDGMTLADWRWAAQKGFWDSAGRRWVEEKGGLQAYISQRNERRVRRIARQSQGLARQMPISEAADVQRLGMFQPHDNGAFPPDFTLGTGQALLDFMIRQGWGHVVMRSYWSSGYQAETIMNIFKELPPGLHAALGQAIDSAQLSAGCAAKHQVPCFVPTNPSIDSTNTNWSMAPQDQAEEAAAEWERDSTHAFLELHFDPRTQLRVAGSANTRAASLLGMAQSDLLERLQRDDVPLPFSPVDAIAMLLHSLRVAREDLDTCYFRLSPSGSSFVDAGTPPPAVPPAVLVCSTTVKDFDACGSVHKVLPPPPLPKPSCAVTLAEAHRKE